MSEDLKKMNDEELWTRWQNYITAAGRVKKELDRWQQAPITKFNKKSSKR